MKTQLSNISNDRAMLLSKCVGCGSKKSKFIKEQEASPLLNKLDCCNGLNRYYNHR